MAQPTKGTGNFLFPLAVVAGAVVVAIAVTFTIGSEEPPDEPTIVGDAEPDQRPAGGGTVPEGTADEEIEGISDQLDEVDPAAPQESSVPPADEAVPDDGSQGETAADENVAGPAEPEVAETEPAQGPEEAGGDEAGGAGTETAPSDEAGGDEAGGTGTTEAGDETDGEVEFGTGDPQQDTAVEDPQAEDLPAGRDAQTELTPEEGQDVVEDTDDGGAAFIPTPSGPEGRDDETIAD